MLRLYRDDLERIVAIVKENCDDVRIEAEGYKLSDIADLDQIKEVSQLETLSAFSVSGSVPRGQYTTNTLSVVLEHGFVPRVGLTDAENAKLYGAAMQIDRILLARVSRLQAATSFPVVGAAVLVGLAAMTVCWGFALYIWLQPWHISRQHPFSGPLLAAVGWSLAAFACIFLASAAPAAAVWVRVRYNLIVYLADSHSHMRLTREQRKQLLNGAGGFALVVLGTVIGGLIVWALTR